MPKRKARKPKLQTAGQWRQPRRRALIAIALLVSLLTATGIIAQRARHRTPLTQTGKLSAESLDSASPSKEYIYGGGRLLATEEATSSACTPPPSPGQTLVAAATSSSQVTLTWLSTGADHYEVQRKQNIVTGSWVTQSPNPTTNSFTDGNVAANTTYLYQVRAVDASGACPSAFSNIDLATTIVFTDDPLTAQQTVIKAVHVSQLRTAVNAVRAAANLGAFTWTDDPLQPRITPIMGVHIDQLRAKLDEALGPLGFTPGGYTDPSPLTGTKIKTYHIDQLRQRVK